MLREGKKVIKPWGYEYLSYQNEAVALWVLWIDSFKETSFHCHPEKNTGLIGYKGNADTYFLNGSARINPGKKINIERGRFHQTVALEAGAGLLEIEHPPNKHDLLRLEDANGRTTSLYETHETNLSDTDHQLFLDEESPISRARFQEIGSLKLMHVTHDVHNQLEKRDFDHLMLTRGGLAHNEKLIVKPGDILDRTGLLRLLKRLEFMPDSTYVLIKVDT